MSRNQRWLAYLVACCLTSLPCSAAVQADGAPIGLLRPPEVVSVTQNLAGNFALLKLERPQRLPLPIMRHLPAADGRALPAVDFPGVVLAAGATSLKFPQAAVAFLNIMQLQAAPPVLRIIFAADNASALNAIDFRSDGNQLLIKLPARRLRRQQPQALPRLIKQAPDEKLNAVQSLPKAAPDVVVADYCEQPPLRGPILLNRPDDASYTVLPAGGQADTTPALPTGGSGFKRALKRLFGSNRPVAAAGACVKPGINDQSVAKQKAESTIVLVDSSARTARLAVAMHAGMSTFRLHNPERYVIDMPSVDKSTLTAPVIPPATFGIKELRLGCPEGSPQTARLVVDLVSPDVVVTESCDAAKHSLILSFNQSVPIPAPAFTADKQPLPANAPALSRPLPDALVLLDAGHGGLDPGAQRGDVQEKEITLAIVEKLKRILETRSVHVKLTRSDDTFVSLQDRVKLTNELKPDLFLSVHINSLETNTQATGIETYYQTDLSRGLAQLIHTSLVKELSEPDRNVRKARFYVINHTSRPAVLAEVGFISNREERARLASSDYQLQVAQALADGIVSYLSEHPQVAASTVQHSH